MDNANHEENRRGNEIAVGDLLPDLAPITDRLDRLADAGKGVRMAMLVLAGALVLHTIVLIATRSRD